LAVEVGLAKHSAVDRTTGFLAAGTGEVTSVAAIDGTVLVRGENTDQPGRACPL
jgi:hypothetical protein